MGFRPSPVRRAKEQVEVQLRDAILSGTFASGDRLPSEMELTESFGVSRTTIREALGGLASAGLISKVPGASGGSFVRTVDHESLGISLGRSIDDTLKFGSINVEEINHVRRLLEVPSSREAALSRSEADIEALRDIVERQKRAALEDPDQMADLDCSFHTKVAGASGNRVLASLVFALQSVIRQTLFLNISPEQGKAAVQQHIDIVRGITSGDPEEAGKAMEDHLDYLDQIQLWRKKPAD